ncbi:MAG: T9SS type A sorting domain-containing protein [Bacteroidota bacterium]|nr:T9SS type A sorting domain-containing protein [Bacteroidota bacterium]
MKKPILISLISLLIMLVSIDLVSQVNRKILFEQFTNASCAPCAARNPAFHALLNANAGKVVLLKYQIWYPGFDPMYNQNPLEPASRHNGYGITSVPRAIMDGNQFNANIDQATQALIDTRYAKLTPIEMKLSHTLNFTMDSIFIKVEIKNVGLNTIGGNSMNVVTCVIEKVINFPAAPGNNGEKDFHAVMRKMVAGVSGEKLGINLAPGESVTKNYALLAPFFIYKPSQIGAISFVQNASTMEVLQVEESLPQPVVGSLLDVSTTFSADVHKGYCDKEVTLTVNVKNESDEEVTSVDVAPLVNGVPGAITSVSGLSIAKGITGKVELLNSSLNDYRSDVNIAIVKVNGRTDGNRFNNNNAIARSFFTLPVATNGAEIHEDFELALFGDALDHVLTDNPSNIRIYPISKDQASPIPTFAIGGFGQSNYSLRFDFFAIGNNLKGSVVFDKMDLSKSTNTQLVFSHGYCQKNVEKDSLIIQISEDCGLTWSTVFGKGGAELATAPAQAATRFYPNPTQWIKDTINLSNYDGKPEVILRFTGRSNAGNSLYVDDVVVAPGSPSAVKDLQSLSVFKVFPNPVMEEISIQLEISEAVQADFSIFDISGRHILDLVKGQKLHVGSNVFNYQNILDSGVYQLQVQTVKGSRTQKFIVN